jgi:hypothetical protein
MFAPVFLHGLSEESDQRLQAGARDGRDGKAPQAALFAVRLKFFQVPAFTRGVEFRRRDRVRLSGQLRVVQLQFLTQGFEAFDGIVGCALRGIHQEQ